MSNKRYRTHYKI